MFLSLLLALAPLLVVADDAQLFRVLHRTFGPDVPEQPFTLRGTIDSSTLQFTPAQAQPAPAHLYTELGENVNNALYQLALQTAPGSADDLGGDRLDISSVKACHIPTASADYLTLHLDNAGTPFHIDYYLADVPASGACPTKKQLRALKTRQNTWLHPSNTTLRVQRASRPPQPELRVPPPLSPKGQVIPPEPEKTFIQKYWIYMVAGLGILLFAGGAPPEEEGAPPSGGR